MRLTQSETDLPVLRPLVGMDKEDTIRIAKSIGSYEISILPYEDCCVLFSPRHPMLRAKLERERASYEELGMESLLQDCLDRIERVDIGISVPGK
jgi:thiamine biosynthesis protein ThiI